MASIPFVTAYGKKKKVTVSFVDSDGVPLPSMTKQAFKDQCDIHRIIKQYDTTGLIQHVNRSTAAYGDFTEVNEYQESLNRVIAAQGAFDALPAAIRKRFGNDPGEFFEFATNPENRDELAKLGLAHAPKTAESLEIEAPAESE